MTRTVDAICSLCAAVLMAYTTLDHTWWVDGGEPLGLLDLGARHGGSWAKAAWGAGLVTAGALAASAFIPPLVGITRVIIWVAVATALVAALAAPDPLAVGVAFPGFLVGCAIALASTRPVPSFLTEPLETLWEDGPYVDGERHGRWFVYQGDHLIRVDVYERGERTSSLRVSSDDAGVISFGREQPPRRDRTTRGR